MENPFLNQHGTRSGFVAALALATLLVACNSVASTTGTFAPLPCTPSTTPSAASVPPGAPAEDICDATEWPSPNGNLYNTRVAHSTITSTNVAKLVTAWTLPLQGKSGNGSDFSNPVLANGIAYVQDGASNVMAVRYATGQVLWTHHYNSPDYGPNGLTVANGGVYGVTAAGAFALNAQTGQQVWYNTHLASRQTTFNIAPQVAGGKVFIASTLTVGGGIIYALDAHTGATLWSFQTVADSVGQQLKSTAGGAWDAMLVGPDDSIYAGIGNPYLSLQEAQANPSRELYTDSIVKLSQATGKLDWYYQAFPDDFHDWDLQISPIYTTTAAGRPVVLAAGKGGFVFAFDATSGQLLWKTAVGIHNGHDNDDQLALEGKLQLTTPYTILPGEIGGVETNMAAAGGTVYVPVVNVPTTYTSATSPLGTPDLTKVAGAMVAIDLATGNQVWSTTLAQMPLGGATISNDLVFTTTLSGEIVALSRQNGAIIWTTQLPAGSNAALAIVGNMLFAGAGIPLASTQHPAVVAFRLGA